MNLKNTVSYALEALKKNGATDSQVVLMQTQGFDVSVRNADVETLEFTGEKSLALTAYIEKQKSVVGISDLSFESIDKAAKKAVEMARVLEADPYEGLPDAALLCTHVKALDLDHPWEITPQDAIRIGIDLEQRALKQNSAIKQSEGVHVSTQRVTQVLANSLGFMHDEHSTRHSLSCVLIAEKNGLMQRDYAYDSRRDPKDLFPAEHIAQEAVQRTIRRLDAKTISTGQFPIIFDARVATGLISHFLSAIHGGALYRKASFLHDHLGKSVFPEHIRIEENPFLLKGMGSCNFDSEGVAVSRRMLIEKGILQGYLLTSYTARRLGMQTTGNAGGAHNVIVHAGDKTLSDMFKSFTRGFYVTELMGQGVNIVTGDYSRGAAGFWVENGEIQYPVEGVTISGHLKDIFANIVTVGADIESRGSIHTGSILIDNMMIAGE